MPALCCYLGTFVPDGDRFQSFYFSYFWKSTRQIPSYTHFLSVNAPNTLYQALTQRCMTQTCREEGVNSQLWWGWGLAVPGVKQQWKALFFSVNLNGLPSIWAGGVDLWGSMVGVRIKGGAILPSQSLPSTTLQQYWDCAVCVFFFCPYEQERFCSPFHLSLVSTQPTTLLLHQTSHLFEFKPEL